MKNIFWAKIKNENGIIKWLPLSHHLKDVAYIIDRLWELWLDEGQKNLIINSLQGNDKNPKKLISFLALIHDFAKASYIFQTGRNIDDLIENELKEKFEKNGIDIIANKYNLASPGKTPHAKIAQSLLLIYGVNDDIAAIVGSHHGKPSKKYEKVYNLVNIYKRNIFQSDLDDDTSKFWKRSLEDLFNWALKKSGYKDVSDLPRISQQGQMILSGLLIMADWIASNENYFPLIEFTQDIIEDEIERYKKGWIKWWKSNRWQPQRYNFDNIYQDRFSYNKPRPIQETFLKIVESIKNPGILIFEAPMGIGKTEAALIAVEQLALKCGKSGMFFGLPTQATSNGIFYRVNNWLNRVAEENIDNYSIRLSHSKAQLNEDYNSIKNNENSASDINSTIGYKGNLLVNEWFSGRKTASLDDFVVGTVDQFLMMALKHKHLALRHLGFSKKVVIIDEVHAYDLYMSQYLKHAIMWAASYNIPVIILSATLPYEKRIELVESYLIGTGLKRREIVKDRINLNTDFYPLITYSDGETIKQFSDFPKEKDKKIEIIKIEYEELTSLVEKMSKSHGVIGIIVNTVKKSQALAKKFINLFDEDKVELLHSSFIDIDRSRKEKDLLRIIGNGKERPDFKIVIGTQVIEQSLDIDFDVMISELCPMDLLLQRMGRLHRHKRVKPNIHKTPKLYIMGTNDELVFDEGTQYIYGGYLLTRTQYFLPDIIMIPSEISKLVQKVYSNIDITLSYNDIYINYKKEQEIKDNIKRKRAETYLLNKPCHNKKGTIIGLLDEIEGTSFENNEEEGKNQVRDIQETIEVIALKKIGNGYGFFNNSIDVSKLDLSYKLEKEISKHTIKLPLSFSMSYNIDLTIKELEKYTLRHFPNWKFSSWLKGCLGIIFNEHNEFMLNECILKYDTKYGLSYERRKNGEI